MRNIPSPKAIARERPFVYPIFHIIVAGESGGFCAERYTTVNTLRVLRLTGGLSSLINLRIEPRAPSLRNVPAGDSVPGSTPRAVCTRVYPGVYSRRGIYPPWYTQGVQ